MGQNKTPSIQSRMKTILIFIVVLLVSTSISASEFGNEYLPPDHWIYAALDRFEALGLCTLPSERLLTRPQITNFVEHIKTTIDVKGITLSNRDSSNLSIMEKEFTDSRSRVDPKVRYDPSLFFVADDLFFLEADLTLSLEPQTSVYDDETDVYVVGVPEWRVHLAPSLTYDTRYRLNFGPEKGDRARDEKPSRREKSFKGLTSLFERSYVSYQKGSLNLLFGRDYIDWGPSGTNHLLLSREAGSLDHIAIRFPIHNVRLSMVHALLSSTSERRLAAHRFEIGWQRLVLGLSESVIYAGRGFDPVYALPLSIFYANQFNERGDDNILWGVDVKAIPVNNILVYGSLLIDDFQFERDDGTPDKLAFNAGGRVVLSHPLALTVEAKYSFADIYTFTHRDSMKSYLTGEADPVYGDVPLGGGHGPDSDVWSVDVTCFPRGDLPVTAGLFYLRRGEGNDYRKFEMGLDPNPSFPLGVVERTLGFSLSISWELPRNSEMSFNWIYRDIENLYNVDGSDDSSSSFRLALTWDL